MAVLNIKELKGAEIGKDIYIIGSGKSIDHIPASFWEGKTCIGTNFCCERIPCKYGITHHIIAIKSILDSGAILIVSEFEMCISSKNRLNFMENYYWFRHPEQTYTQITLNFFDDPEYLTAGGTIVTSALNLAYRLGAKNIILAGVDGGSIDGIINYKDYPLPTNEDHPTNVRNQLEKISNHIRGKGVPVISLNPFLNFTNEGHAFTEFHN
jgi:hypothetical protein